MGVRDIIPSRAGSFPCRREGSKVILQVLSLYLMCVCVFCPESSLLGQRFSSLVVSLCDTLEADTLGPN